MDRNELTQETQRPHGGDGHDDGRASLRRRTARALFSAALFVIALELSLGAMQRFSFPYLPLFARDATFGVTLTADASARVRTRDGHVTTVRTNAQGFRGAPLVAQTDDSARARRRVLLVGDSQAMGLHVEAHETVSVALSRALDDADVLTAAVPTYGPLEYATLVERFAGPLAIDTVVVLFAPANDFFEARVWNRSRTTAALGFAARVTRPNETERSQHDEGMFTTSVEALLGRSHIVYTARRILGTASDQASLVDAPSLLARIGRDLARVTPPSKRALDDTNATFASRLGPALKSIRDACERAGCRVIASVLPLDVEIEDDAWRKYARGPARASHEELRASVPEIVRALRAGAHDDMRTLGITSLDLSDALSRAAPGVFLADDDHLSARGHAAVARALATLLVDDGARTAHSPLVKDRT